MSVLQFQTSWWDILPLEIQLYIRQLADRAHHQDQLRIVHEVIERFWDICVAVHSTFYVKLILVKNGELPAVCIISCEVDTTKVLNDG